MNTKRLIVLLLVLTSFGFGQVDSLWERTAEDGTLPSWFDTGHLTRGFAYGNVGGNDRLYVVSRNGGNNVYILDALTGADVGSLSTTGISGGTYLLSDIDVTEDGVIFMCNLTTNSSTSGLKVYRWDSESDDPTMVIDWTGGSSFRLGDKMSASGSVSDNSAYLSFGAANSDSLVNFLTDDNGASWDASIYYTGVSGGSADASVTPDGGSWYNATGINPVRFSAEGTLLGTVPGGVVPTGSNAIQYLAEVNGVEYVATFNYGTGNEKAIIFRAPADAPETASSYGVTPSLFLNSNANGAGDVAVMDNGDGSATLFVLSTNNGIGAYTVAFPAPAMEANNMESAWWADVTNYDFFNNDNNTRGMGYNPITDHLLIASRSGGTNVHIIDANSGAVLGTLDMTGVSGGTFPINKVVVDDAGVIYVSNLTVAGTGYKVYRWADESAVPTVAFEGDLVGRAGDAMGISGSGTETVIYASGASSTEVAVLETADGLTYTAGTAVSISAGKANGGISAVEDTSIAINSAWGDIYHIDVQTGAFLDTVAGDFIPTYYGNVRYMKAPNGAEMLIVNTNHQADHYRELEVYLIADSGIELYAAAEMGGLEYGNANVTGDAWYRMNGDNTVTIFQMASNNGIAAWNMELPPTEAYISDYALEFGDVAINANASLTFQIGNVGDADLIVNSMSVDDAIDYSFDFVGPDTLAPGDTIDVSVTFSPLFEGASDANLDIATDAGDYGIQLFGSGYTLWPLDWRHVADTTTWIGQGDLVRGVAFNRTTGHILVPSRVGGSFVHILDGNWRHA